VLYINNLPIIYRFLSNHTDQPAISLINTDFGGITINI
jgi:hypothetical protein